MKSSTPSLVRRREQLVDLVEVGFLVDRRVGADQEAGLLGGLDALDGVLEDAVALDGLVVRLLQAVEVDVEEEPAASGGTRAAAS